MASTNILNTGIQQTRKTLMNNKIIFLYTMDQQRRGTLTHTDYSGIFIKAEHPANKSLLDSTEKNVLDFMLSENADSIRCGCVEGITEDGFSNLERNL